MNLLLNPKPEYHQYCVIYLLQIIPMSQQPPHTHTPYNYPEFEGSIGVMRLYN